jgi:hypothetical protein
VFNFANPSDVVTVSAGNNPVAAAFVSSSQDSIEVLQFALAGPGNKAATVTDITFTNTGTATPATEITEVRLYYDTNSDGLLDANDVLSGTRSAWSSNTIAFSGIDIEVLQNQTLMILAVAKTSASGVSGHTFTLQIASAGAVAAIPSVSVVVTGSSVTSNAKTFSQGQVSVTATDIGDLGFDPTGGPLVAVLDVVVSVTGPAAELNSFTVKNTASPGSSFLYTDVTSVQIFSNVGLTTPVSSVVAFTSPEMLVALTGAPVISRESDGAKHYYVGYTLANQSPILYHRFFPQVTAVGITTNVGQLATSVPTPLTGTDHSLPVEFASFSAEAIGQVVKLAWVTESETDNLAWFVERREVSASDASFVQIHRLNGAGSTPFRTEYEFVDRNVVPGVRYAYRLTDISSYGVLTSHEVREVTAGGVLAFSLDPAFPNPFNPSTTIRFALPEAGAVHLTVYDVTGRVIRTLVDGTVEAGAHKIVWDGRDMVGREAASGVYIYRLVGNHEVLTKRMVLAR